MKDITIRLNNPTIAGLVSANVDIPESLTAAYQPVWELLGGKGQRNAVVTNFKGKGYLPKVYLSREGEPVLQWGTTTLDLDFNSDLYTLDLEEDKTGSYEETHVVLTYAEGGGELSEDNAITVAFPIRIKSNDDRKAFKAAAKFNPADALRKYVSTVDETIGLEWLDTNKSFGESGEVTITGYVEKQFDNGVSVTAKVLYQGQPYKCRTSKDAGSTLRCPLIDWAKTEDHFLIGTVGKGKEHLNVKSVVIPPEAMDLTTL